MFERHYESAEPAVLNEDQSAVLRREVNEMLSAMHYLSTLCEPGKPVDRQLIHSILYTSEARLAQVGQLTGVETDSAADRERRHTAIRAANMRVHELERQLGGSATAEQTKQAVAYLNRKLSSWWRKHGLGLVREATMDSWGGLSATMSCMLFGTKSYSQSETPVSDKAHHAQWLESLRAQGFVLAEGQGTTGQLAACDASRDAFLRLVQTALPSAKIQSINTRAGRKEVAVMADVRIYIENLDDVANLPDPAADE